MDPSDSRPVPWIEENHCRSSVSSSPMTTLGSSSIVQVASELEGSLSAILTPALSMGSVGESSSASRLLDARRRTDSTTGTGTAAWSSQQLDHRWNRGVDAGCSVLRGLGLGGLQEHRFIVRRQSGHVSEFEIAEQFLGIFETPTPTFVQLLHGPDGRPVWCLDAGLPRLGPQ